MFRFLNLIPWYYKVLAVAIFCAGLFGAGYLKGHSESTKVIAKYEASVANHNSQVAIGESKVNDNVITKYVDRVKIVYKDRVDVQTVIEHSLPSTDWTLPTGWIYIYNKSVTGGTPDATEASNATPSNIDNKNVLSVAADNNATCRETQEQLLALQQWIRDSKKNVENSNKGK